MFPDFMAQLTNTLLSQGFQYGQNADGSASAATYIRQDGGVLYAAVLWDADALGAESLSLREAHMQKELAAYGGHIGCRSTIFFSIAAHRAPSPWLDARLQTAEPFYGQPMYTLAYDVDFAGRQLRFHPDAPASLAGMDVTLSNILHGAVPEAYKPAPDIPPRLSNEWLVYLILVINACILTLMELRGGSENIDALLQFGALQRELVIHGHEWHRLFTAFFIHIGIPHFLHNGLSLFIFGSRVERHFGRARFLVVYMLAGLAGNAAQLMMTDAISAGASGAIYGLMGATLAITQTVRKSVDGLPFFVMLLFMATGLAQGFVTPGIGNAAHVGGVIAGYVVGLGFCLSDRHKKKPV